MYDFDKVYILVHLLRGCLHVCHLKIARGGGEIYNSHFVGGGNSECVKNACLACELGQWNA